MRRWAVPVLLILGAHAGACMWDTDTLAEEASFGKDFVSTITGRFPRNPPLYYAMRRDRLLAKRAKTLDDYDDLAVSYERLGDSLSALKWIDRKPRGTSTDEYRTRANRGTFLVHAYLAGKLGVDEAERGLGELEKAVAINPDAHFGRERVQIRLVGEIIDPGGPFHPDENPLKAAEGYAGIVRLGAGWGSPDVFRAMAVDLADYRHYGSGRLGAVASLALLRADELVRAGHKPRLADDFRFVEGAQTPSLEASTRREFRRLRDEADAWQARRTAFMMARLRAGRHPDTDPGFWQGWVDGPSPEVHDRLIERNPFIVIQATVVGFVLVLSTTIVLSLLTLWRRAAKLGRGNPRVQ